MRLYPTVNATLAELRRKGVLLIGYTESLSFYTVMRVRRLGLDGLLDFLYSPPDHELPAGAWPEQEHYQLRATVHRHTPQGERKPNPRLLLDILQEVGAQPEQTIYVGDNLIKDVAMAQEAGITDVLAEYGAAHDHGAYELLRRATHWSDAELGREKSVMMQGTLTPTVVLRRTFSELLALFSFARFREPIRLPDQARAVRSPRAGAAVSSSHLPA